MIEHRLITELTLAEALVLIEPMAALAVFGQDLATLPGPDDRLLFSSLPAATGTLIDWQERLAGLSVPLIDVNTASSATLARIPGLTATQVKLVIDLRPYFSLSHLRAEGTDLAAIAAVGERYLAHAGYDYVDKPAQKPVNLQPASAGLLLRYEAGAQDAAFMAAVSVGLQSAGIDPDERILALRWTLTAEEQPAALRRLKRADAVVGIAPCLLDSEGQLRWPYPDRLDLALHNEANPAVWEQLITRYNLTQINLYMTNFGSLRVRCHVHDLGALYRFMRAMAGEPNVDFVEPTYLTVGIS